MSRLLSAPEEKLPEQEERLPVAMPLSAELWRPTSCSCRGRSGLGGGLEAPSTTSPGTWTAPSPGPSCEVPAEDQDCSGQAVSWLLVLMSERLASDDELHRLRSSPEKDSRAEAALWLGGGRHLVVPPPEGPRLLDSALGLPKPRQHPEAGAQGNGTRKPAPPRPLSPLPLATTLWKPGVNPSPKKVKARCKLETTCS